jgi:hypothetical protein
MRFSFFWTHAFSAAVILGAIVIRAPDCTLAATSLSEFGKQLISQVSIDTNKTQIWP